MLKKLAGVCLYTIACCACASGVKVTKLDPAVDSPGTRVGIPYNLSLTQYEIKITRQLEECGTHPKLVIKADIKADKVLDPSQMYLLSSDGTFGSSDIKAEYDVSGISTSLNATSEDATPAAVGDFIKGLAQVVGLVVGAVGAGEGRAPDADTRRACWPKAYDALVRISGIPATKKAPAVEGERAAVERLTRDLALQTATVNQLTTSKSSDKKLLQPL